MVKALAGSLLWFLRLLLVMGGLCKDKVIHVKVLCNQWHCTYSCLGVDLVIGERFSLVYRIPYLDWDFLYLKSLVCSPRRLESWLLVNLLITMNKLWVIVISWIRWLSKLSRECRRLYLCRRATLNSLISPCIHCLSSLMAMLFSACFHCWTLRIKRCSLWLGSWSRCSHPALHIKERSVMPSLILANSRSCFRLVLGMVCYMICRSCTMI